MGIRGVIGFRFNEMDKLLYNDTGSSPSSLGRSVLNWCRQQEDWQTVRNLVGQLLVTDDRVLEGGVMTSFGGSLDDMLMAPALLDGFNFILNSLYCDWGYIINLDEEVLEIYEGHQKVSHEKGRYSLYEKVLSTMGETIEDRGGGFRSCALVASYPLHDLPVQLPIKF